MKTYLVLLLFILSALFTNACRRSPVSSAIKAIEEGDLQKAETLLLKVIQDDPNDPSALMNLAIVHLKKDQANDAMIEFSKVAERVPDDPRPLEYLASILMYNDSWKEAGDMLTEAANRAPNSPSILTAQALVDLKLSTPQAAKDRLLKVISIDPTYAPALFNLAVIDRDWLKNPVEGKRYFQRYLATAKDDIHITIARQALTEKTRPPTTKKAATTPSGEEATAPVPATPSVVPPRSTTTANSASDATEAFRQGVNLYQAGQTDKAIDEYKRAIQMNPSLVRAHYNLGLLLRIKGDLAGARACFEKALEISPNMVDARYMLAYVMIAQGKDNEALPQLKAIVEKAPKHADAHLALATLYRKDKTLKNQARKEYATYLELAPDGLAAREARNWLKYNP